MDKRWPSIKLDRVGNMGGQNGIWRSGSAGIRMWFGSSSSGDTDARWFGEEETRQKGSKKGQ